MPPEPDSPRPRVVATNVRTVERPPLVEADYLSASQRSTIRRAVQDAIDAHGVEYAMRNTCAELEENTASPARPLDICFTMSCRSRCPKNSLLRVRGIEYEKSSTTPPRTQPRTLTRKAP